MIEIHAYLRSQIAQNDLRPVYSSLFFENGIRYFSANPQLPF